MLKCPMCEKAVPEHDKVCGKCGTDVSLLVNYVDDLEVGLRQAEALTRRGELGDAVWKYLEILEIDPDNAVARRQVGRVATAVRQFDEKAPGRRWFKKLQKQNRWRRFVSNMNTDGDLTGWLTNVFWVILVFSALIFGYLWGMTHAGKAGDGGDKKDPPAKTTKLAPQKKQAEVYFFC
jgi:hypothetical protein